MRDLRRVLGSDRARRSLLQPRRHSLLAMQAAVRIEERLGLDAPVSLVFDHPTPVRWHCARVARACRGSAGDTAGRRVFSARRPRTRRLAPERAVCFSSTRGSRRRTSCPMPGTQRGLDRARCGGTRTGVALHAALTNLIERRGQPRLAGRRAPFSGIPIYTP